ncbi:MAG TPA: hypothetical protein VK588_01455 [Chitinophagaceae bacterium]|nr:hypothetical protein [Chitinophagaceae bacterium]
MKRAIFKNEKNNKRILQGYVKKIGKNPNEFEDVMDILVAEGRKDEKGIRWSTAKKQLRKNGKL